MVEEAEVPELPGYIRAAWGIERGPRRGPKRELEVGRIVEAATTVARTEGLGAVSMGKVAKEVGASTMALYRYVASKEELLHLMSDAAFGPAPASLGDAGWRDGLEQWSWAMLGGYRANAWALEIPIQGFPDLPNAMSWLESGLTCLAGTGLRTNERMSTVLLVSSYVRSWATLTSGLEAALRARGQDVAESARSFAGIVRHVVGSGDYPQVATVADEGFFEVNEEDPDDDFRFGLDRVLDGIAVLVERRGGVRRSKR